MRLIPSACWSRNSQGLTLVEVLVAIGVGVLIIGALALFVGRGFGISREQFEQVRITEDARNEIERIGDAVRNARNLDVDGNGTFDQNDQLWLAAAGNYSIQFYTNLDTDGNTELVRYFLEGTDLKRGVIEPASDGTYPAGQEEVTVLARSLRNSEQTTPMFIYYSFGGEAATILDPTTMAYDQVGRVGIRLLVDVNPTQRPPQADVQTDPVVPRQALATALDSGAGGDGGDGTCGDAFCDAGEELTCPEDCDGGGGGDGSDEPEHCSQFADTTACSVESILSAFPTPAGWEQIVIENSVIIESPCAPNPDFGFLGCTKHRLTYTCTEGQQDECSSLSIPNISMKLKILPCEDGFCPAEPFDPSCQLVESIPGCEPFTYNGKKYQVCSEYPTWTWDAAQRFCAQNGYVLADMSDTELTAALVGSGLTDKLENWWIGLRQLERYVNRATTDDWQWHKIGPDVNATTSTWAAGEPDDGTTSGPAPMSEENNEESCGYMRRGLGRFGDAPCSPTFGTFGFICEQICEGSIECNDGADNDDDLLVDFDADPECDSLNDPSERAQCDDGLDNDGDSLIDLNDSGCQNAQDNDEADDGPQEVCGDGFCSFNESADPTSADYCPGDCFCGNNSKDQGEDCDEVDGVFQGYCIDPFMQCNLNTNCQCAPSPPGCGNGIIESPENCEPPDYDKQPSGFSCPWSQVCAPDDAGGQVTPCTCVSECVYALDGSSCSEGAGGACQGGVCVQSEM